MTYTLLFLFLFGILCVRVCVKSALCSLLIVSQLYLLYALHGTTWYSVNIDIFTFCLSVFCLSRIPLPKQERNIFNAAKATQFWIQFWYKTYGLFHKISMYNFFRTSFLLFIRVLFQQIFFARFPFFFG